MRIALAALLTTIVALAGPATAQSGRVERSIQPYIEVDQVVTASSASDDVLTYTTAIAGVDASIQTRRTAVQVSVQYAHDFAWSKHDRDSDYVTGLARARIDLTRHLTLDAGALATRTRDDIRGAAAITPFGRSDNSSQLYSLYAGPTYTDRFGPVNVLASYQIGYTKADTPDDRGFVPGPALDYFDDAVTQVAQASASVRSGVLAPFGMTLSGAWERDDAGQLSQRFDDRYVRFDVVQPVSATLALQAGVGYEDVEVSQKDPLLDASGAPVVDRHGRFRTDSDSPRRIAYDFDGLYWDAGVVWKPSPRTQLEAHVGRRYDSWTGYGVFNYAPAPDVALQVDVYDAQQTFGHQLQDSLKQLPTSFVASRNRFGQPFNGCVFGRNGKAGGCLDGVLQSITTASYRARGVDAIATLARGPNTFGVGAGYASRHFHQPDGVPGIIVYGAADDWSYYAEGFYQRQIDPLSSFDANLFFDYYDSGIRGAPGVLGTGATGTYYRSFGRIGATASLGIYYSDQRGYGHDTTAQGLLGVRYNF